MLKRVLTLAAAASLAVVALAGCNSGEVGGTSSTASTGGDNASGTSESAKLTGTLTMAGSTSMDAICSAINEAFKEENPDLTIDLQFGGSGAAITALNEERADIGNLSRAVKDEENPDGNFEVITIALDGIAVVVHPDNPVADLTMEQLADIFTGEITNWSDVGGNDGTITVIGRESGSGTRDGFEDIVDVADACQYAAQLDSTGAVVSRVASDANAIGYVSLASVNDQVKAVSVAGVAPSMDTVADGTYVLQRPFVQAYKKGTVNPNVLAYLEFLKTDTVGQLMEDEGLVRVEFWK